MDKKQKRQFTDDFKREAVRVALTSGQTVAQPADAGSNDEYRFLGHVQ